MFVYQGTKQCVKVCGITTVDTTRAATNNQSIHVFLFIYVPCFYLLSSCFQRSTLVPKEMEFASKVLEKREACSTPFFSSTRSGVVVAFPVVVETNAADTDSDEEERGLAVAGGTVEEEWVGVMDRDENRGWWANIAAGIFQKMSLRRELVTLTMSVSSTMTPYIIALQSARSTAMRKAVILGFSEASLTAV